MKSHERESGLRRNLSLRIAFAVAGTLWFIWLGIEDPGSITVLLLAIASLAPALIISLHRFVFPLARSDRRRSMLILLIGLLSGLLVAPLSIILMAVKTSLHNHVVPDFTRTDVLAVLRSTPAWTLGALLLAAAGAILDRTLEE